MTVVDTIITLMITFMTLLTIATLISGVWKG